MSTPRAGLSLGNSLGLLLGHSLRLLLAHSLELFGWALAWAFCLASLKSPKREPKLQPNQKPKQLPKQVPKWVAKQEPKQEPKQVPKQEPKQETRWARPEGCSYVFASKFLNNGPILMYFTLFESSWPPLSNVGPGEPEHLLPDGWSPSVRANEPPSWNLRDLIFD